MIKRICGPNLFHLFVVLLIGVAQFCSACQPPIHYHSSAAYGSPQFQPDSQQTSEFQSSLQDELVQNQVQAGSPDATSLDASSLSTQATSTANELIRPPNPFVPIESQSAEKSATECANKNLQAFMDVLDCTSVETYNTDGATARYGTNDCGFESQNLCRFYSDPNEELQFRRGIFAHHNHIVQQNDSQFPFNPFEDTFSTLTNRPLGSVPDKNFLVVVEPFGNTPKVTAILQTDIRCQIGDGQLSFDYWTNVREIDLKVCTRVGDDRRCTTEISYAQDSTNIQVQIVHPEGNSFVVEIVVTNFNRPGFFIIDNLKYQADLCEITSDFPAVSDQHLIARPSSNARAFSQPNFDIDGPLLSINGKPGENLTTPPSTEIKADEVTQEVTNVPAVLVDNETKRWMSGIKIQKVGESACEVLNCNFNHDLCRYSQAETQDDLMNGRWQTANLRLEGNSTRQGQEAPEGFAFVGMSDRSAVKTKGRKIFVMESGEFQLNNDATLSFDLYRRSNSISLQICVDSLSNCLYEAPPVRSTSYWKLGESVLLPRGSKKIYFVAEQLKRFKWLAIDNLKLLSYECKSV